MTAAGVPNRARGSARLRIAVVAPLVAPLLPAQPYGDHLMLLDLARGFMARVALPFCVLLLRDPQTAVAIDSLCPLWPMFNGRAVTAATSANMPFAFALWGTAALVFLAGMFRAARLPAPARQPD